MGRLIAVIGLILSMLASVPHAVSAQVDDTFYQDPTLGYTVDWDPSWTVLANEDSTVGGHTVFLHDGTGGLMVFSTIAAPESAEQCINIFAPNFSEASGFEDVGPIPGTAGGDTYNGWETWTANAIEGEAVYPTTIDFHCRVLQEPLGSVLTIAFAPTDLYEAESLRLEQFVAESVLVPMQPGSNRAFVSDRWFTNVIAAGSADSIPQADLNQLDGKVWMLAIADVTNISAEDASFKPDDILLDLSKGEPVELNLKATAKAAEAIGIEPLDPAAGVSVPIGSTRRVALVYATTAQISTGTLVRGSDRLPLDDLLTSEPVDLESLAPLSSLPYLERATVVSVQDGQTMTITGVDGVTHDINLAGYEAPAGSDCFANDATRRLRKLAGETVWVQAGVDSVWVWRERSNGMKALINQEMIEGGYANASVSPDFPLSSWLMEAERIATSDGVGLWTDCQVPEATATDESAGDVDTNAGVGYDGTWGGPTTNNGSFGMNIEDNQVVWFDFSFTCTADPNSSHTGAMAAIPMPLDGGGFSIVMGDWTIEGTFDSANTMSGTAHFDVGNCIEPVDLEFVGIKLP